MLTIRSLVVGSGLAVSFATCVGCADPQPDLGGSSGSDDGESTVSPSSTGTGSGSTGSGSTSSETGAVDESTTAEEPDPYACHDPRPLPLPLFDCSGVNGTMEISAVLEEGDDPSVLEGVRWVEGSIHINRTDLTNLDFMGCVEGVTGSVVIYGNDALTNVDGLQKLRSIGGNFVFSHNASLTDFDGLPNLIEMVGTVLFEDNASLEVITGFHSLDTLLGRVFIDQNGQEAFQGGNLWIHSNPVLRNMDGFGQLTTVHGLFVVAHNPSLCISSVNCVGSGITDPETPPDDWTTQANDNGC